MLCSWRDSSERSPFAAVRLAVLRLGRWQGGWRRGASTGPFLELILGQPFRLVIGRLDLGGVQLDYESPSAVPGVRIPEEVDARVVLLNDPDSLVSWVDFGVDGSLPLDVDGLLRHGLEGWVSVHCVGTCLSLWHSGGLCVWPPLCCVGVF